MTVAPLVRIDRRFQTTAHYLSRLLRIPSVSAPGGDPHALRRCALETASLLRRSGVPDVRLLNVAGAPPFVYGRRPGRPGAPRVLLYAHYDVQPPGDTAAWTAGPFDPVERDGRLHARGAADNKAGVVVHAAALAALEGPAPDLTVLIEGEEEIGSPHLATLLEQHGARLKPDVVINTDAAVPNVDQPALTVSLRGMVDCIVEVRTLDRPLHSGVFGGAAPDALSALVRLLASLHDDAGVVTIDGCDQTRDTAPWSSAAADVASGLTDLVRPESLWVSGADAPRRLWQDYAVSILGIDAPAVREASTQLLDVARAKVSLRIGPRKDPRDAAAALCSHLQTRAPWGAAVDVIPGASVAGVSIDPAHPVLARAQEALGAAWGRRPVLMGSGGSVPAMAALARCFPGTPVVMFGAADPTSRSHGPDESVDLGTVRRAAAAECALLEQLACDGSDDGR